MIRVKKITAAALFSICVLISGQGDLHIYAYDFEGNEDAWLNRCSVPQDSQEKAQECAAFKAYYQEQSDALAQQVDDLDQQVALIQDDIEKISEAIQKQEALIETYENKIQINEENIKTISAEIKKLEEQIEEKEISIQERNELIRERMRSDQASTGTNLSLEIIMGSSDLIDMLRKIEGLQRIRESDQQEIDKMKEEQAQLELDKEEADRLKEDAIAKKAENEESKKEAEKVKEGKETLLVAYRKMEADYFAKLRAAEADLNSMKGAISEINTSVKSNYTFTSSTSLAKPIHGSLTPGGGTWYYGSGGVHLGADIGVGIGTPIYAPANGIILYAGKGFPTNGGYLTNMDGWPYGAGNDILFLTRVDNTTYAISFAHMANENFLVSAGDKVSKGQMMGATGNSGNSSGPHCHIEVINLGNMSLETAITRFQSTADFAFGCSWGTAALSRICSVSGAPCRERPEEIFGY